MADSNLFARFYIHPQLQQEQSKEEGRPVYKEVEYVEIFIKGQKNSTFSRAVTDEDKADYPIAWKAFKENNPDLTEGTPIKFLAGVGPGVVLELNGVGVRTIEDMAELTDAGLDNIRGGRMLQQRAKAYLASLEIKPEPETVEDDSPVDVDSLKQDESVVAKSPVKKRKKTAKAKKVA